jgi:methionine-S-sulfoxide reductase
MGCFWEPAEELLKVDGVIDTIAGYTGNPKSNSSNYVPNYESVCYGNEWVEGVRVKFDDEQISYEEILDAFYDIQKPKLGSRQYASIVFPHDLEQQQTVEVWMKQNAGRQRKDGWRVEWTSVEPLSKFFKAEGYHQQYWQKQRPRFAIILALLAVATGVIDPVIPPALQHTAESVSNGAVVVIGLLVILERFLDSKVVEL